MSIACAQCFYLDPALVKNSGEVSITSVDLFFKAKPHPTANKSGIANPGVTVELVPVIGGVPAIPSGPVPTARATWDKVAVTLDASVPTTFSFSPPAQVSTGTEYAIVVSYDGDEDFDLWTCVTGDDLLGTTTVATGPSSQYATKYFLEGSMSAPVAAGGGSVGGLATTGSADQGSANNDYLQVSWRASSTTDLKFRVRVARYAFDGDANLAAHVTNSVPSVATIYGQSGFVSLDANGNYVVPMPAARYEYVTYDRYSSASAGVLSGELAFQNTVFWPGGTWPATVAAVANSNVLVGNGVDWTTALTMGADPEYLVITSLNHRGPNADSIAVRRVVSVLSNTSVQLDQPMPFTNSAAYFFRSAVATVDVTRQARVFGSAADLLVLRDSTANSSVRFANDTVLSVALNAGGSGYSNTDYVVVRGYEDVPGKVAGGYPAYVTLVTNSSGGVTGTFISNVGCGFSNAAAITYSVANSSGGASLGSGLSLGFTVGAVIKTEFYGANGAGGYYANCKVVNLEVGDVAPAIPVSNPPGTFFSLKHRMPYYVVDDASTVSGRAYYCDVDGAWDEYEVTPLTLSHPWDLSKRRVFPSWSNEFNVLYANGAACNAAGGSTIGPAQPMSSNCSVLTMTVASNNDYVAARAAPRVTALTVTRYVVNDDRTLEETDHGAAWAKGVETRLVFANNASAEDLRVYATAWVPAGTSVWAYARLYSSVDGDAFVDKDWTLLELDPLAGPVTVSSLSDVTDTRELTFRIPPTPNTTPLAGYATSALGSANLVGTGTSWASNASVNVAVGSLVKLYSPLFPNTYQVSVVTAVTDTSMTLSDAVSNTGLVGSGMAVDRVDYPRQAFNYVLNENVVRYYTTTGQPVDGFDAMQLKLVLLSSDARVYPAIDDVRAVGISA